MGVPAFFRWLSRKYPSIVVHCVEEKGQEVDGVRAPIDSSQPNPNDYEFDNLYLDMNGIIHPCCHPENKEAPKNEDEMMVAIFEYIDRIFAIVRPRKLLYMAIDGVAPRAKMNQQRSRRFRASKESREHKEEITRIRSELREKGCSLPPEKEKREHFDSNCITPGTEFMANLSVCLRYYIADRLNHDPGWKNIKVILSDANVPGEGEHKIMDYIRKQRACPGHDPNTRHCLNGADADLIMLGLATHELHFTIIREEFKPNQKKPCEICGQTGHMMDECQGLPKEKQGEFDELPKPVAQEVEFIFIRLNVLREYLERDLRMEGLPFPYNFERCLDDWVFMCFFVGNDFLPHLPSLQIREGAIDRLIRIYKSVLPRCGGYLSENGIVSLRGVQSILTELGKMEDEIFKKRQENDLAFRRREKEKKERMKRQRQSSDRPLWTPEGQFAPQPIGSNPAPLMGTRQEAFAMRRQGMEATSRNKANFSAANDLRAMLTPTPDGSLTPQTTPGQTPPSSKRKAEDEEDDDAPKDNIRLWEDGWKERYYERKFDVSRDDETYDDFRKTVADAYVEGLCWVLGYYYQGCPSWKWFYPYHYAPFASDFRDIESLPNTFEKGTQPFKPLEQLMGVFPAASGNFLPVTWRRLMMDPESPIIDFYPVDFSIDLNGKKYAWQGVALLPFVEEKRLLDALAVVYPDLTQDEMKRNSRGKDRLFVREGHPACDFFVGLYEGGETKEALEIVPDLTHGMSGAAEPDDTPHLPGRVVKSPLPNLYDLKDNRAISVKFSDPSFADTHIFSASVLPKTEPPPRVLKPEGYDNRTPYRPNVGMNPYRSQRAQLDQSGHRMIDFFTNAGRRNAASAPPHRGPGFSGAQPYQRSNQGTPLSSRDQPYRHRNYNDTYYGQDGRQRHSYGGGGDGRWSSQQSYQRDRPSNHYGNSSQYSSHGGQGYSRDPRQYNQSQRWQDPRQRGDDRRRSYPPGQNHYRPY